MSNTKEANREYQRAWRAANRERNRATKLKYEQTHREQLNAARRLKNKENPIRARAIFKRRWKALRLKALQFLGGACCQCGFSDYRALQIDHIVAIGQKGRPTSKAIQAAVLRGEPNFQLLCANCNSIKRYTHHECDTPLGETCGVERRVISD